MGVAAARRRAWRAGAERRSAASAKKGINSAAVRVYGCSCTSSGASHVRPRRRRPALRPPGPRPRGRRGRRTASWREATRRVRALVTAEGRLSSERLEAHQHAAHGLAWLATYARGRARARGLCGAPRRRGPVRRDRGPPRPDRARRVSRPDLRRHPDEPGRDRPPVGARALRPRRSPLPHRKRSRR